jgi:hypothetical protein
VIREPPVLLDIPLRWKREVIVSALGEIALLESPPIGERDVVKGEGAHRVRMSEIADDGFRMLARIEQDVGHPAFLPTLIGSEMAVLAGFRTNVPDFDAG